MLRSGQMRYQQVCERFSALLSARDDSAREWQVSDHVVMVVEFDIFSAAKTWISVPCATGRRDPLVRIAFFERQPGDAVARVDAAHLPPVELKRASEFRALVDRWVAGDLDELPPSTSRIVGDRLRVHT